MVSTGWSYKLQKQLNPALSQEKFSGRVISRLSEFNWPAKSYDLTPLDCFLWGYTNDRVQAKNPQNLGKLENNIREVLDEISLKVGIKIYFKRIEAYKRFRGGHSNDVLFHLYCKFQSSYWI